MGPSSRIKYFTTRTRIHSSVQKATVQFWTPTRITLTGWTNCQQDTSTTYTQEIGLSALQLNVSNDEQSITQIQQALLQGEIDVVSNGSFCPIKGLGAAGWVIETK